MNDKILEWPSDEYLDGLTQQEFEDLQLTEISWLLGTEHGPEHDYCHAFKFKNNLDDARNTSPAYGSKTSPEDRFEFEGKRIAKIGCVTNMHHVFAFKFKDDYDNVIGKPLYSKYDEASDEEFEVEIAPDEKVIGFVVRQSDWVDCKTAKVAFKIAKTKTVDQELVQKVAEYKAKQKQMQAELEAKLPRDTAFCLERWDPVGGDIKWHDHESGWKESVIQSRPQCIALMKEKSNQKDIGFLQHVSQGVKAIIEKKLTGQFHPNGCSIYLWATKQDDKNQLNQQLGVIAGSGFVQATTKVDEGVKDYDDALARIQSKPKGDKNCFYTYNSDDGTIGKYTAEEGKAGLKQGANLFTFFWGEEIDLKL